MKLGGTRWIATGAGAGLLALVLAGSGGLAQEATPMAEATPEAVPITETGQPHPAHIHAGTCENLDPTPLFPLADIIIPTVEVAAGMATPVMDTGMATPIGGDIDEAGLAAAAAFPAGQSTTVVQAALTDLLAAAHAINVHLSYEEVDIYVACGTIGGTPDANGNLFIGLAEQNASGYSGIAWLHDNGDGTTTVTVFLAFGLTGAETGAMDATLEGGAVGTTPEVETTPDASPAM